MMPTRHHQPHWIHLAPEVLFWGIVLALIFRYAHP